jgi:hypothetical protein
MGIKFFCSYLEYSFKERHYLGLVNNKFLICQHFEKIKNCYLGGVDINNTHAWFEHKFTRIVNIKSVSRNFFWTTLFVNFVVHIH